MQTFNGIGATPTDIMVFTAPFDGWYSLRVHCHTSSGSNAVHVNVNGAAYPANTVDNAIQLSTSPSRRTESQAVDAYMAAGETVGVQTLGAGTWSLKVSVERLGDDI